MANPKCETCAFRKKYDNNPKSFLGRLWHWHAGWCPGWKAYLKTLSEEEKNSLLEKYSLKE